MGLSEAEQVHTFELTGDPPGLSATDRSPAKRDIRAEYAAMPLGLLQGTLDDMENYLDGRWWEKLAYCSCHHGGPPMDKRDYRIALEVCQQREQEQRAKRNA